MNNIRTTVTTLNKTLPITITCNAVGCGFKAEWGKNKLGHYKSASLAVAYVGNTEIQRRQLRNRLNRLFLLRVRRSTDLGP